MQNEIQNVEQNMTWEYHQTLSLLPDSNIKQCGGLKGCPGKGRKEGRTDQGTLKQLGEGLPSQSLFAFLYLLAFFLALACAPWNSLVLGTVS